MTKEQEYRQLGRMKARTDLQWLARHILGMDKIVPHVHGPLADSLQKFDNYQGVDVLNEETNLFTYNPINYDPVNVMFDERKRRLLLAPRGWFKTSLNIIAHSIQWILNYPDITIVIIHASQEMAEQILADIKRAFWRNNVMRYFFPEFCQPESAKEFGTQTKFDIPSRKKWTVSPTLSVAGIESVRTGMHYHVLKFTDIVDDKNAGTKDQCEKIVYAYGMARNLLIAPSYWIDVEGTRYDFSDLYGRIIDNWLKEKVETPEGQPEKHEFNCFVMGCYKKNLLVEKYTPDELDEPYIVESRFPEKDSTEDLVRMQHDTVVGESLFNSQQLNNPVGTENVMFPKEDLLWKSSEDMKRVPIQYYMTTVDLAETRNKNSDFTVITTCGVDRVNRRYVVDIQMGRYMPDEIVDLLFVNYIKWKPIKIKIEETGFARGLRPTVIRQSQILGLYPNFEFLPRDTQQSKVERIKALQPFYKSGLLIFNSDLAPFVKDHLIHELTRFPKYKHDDILDTLADQFQNEHQFGPSKPSPKMENLLLHAEKVMYEKTNQYESIFGKKKEHTTWSGLGAL